MAQLINMPKLSDTMEEGGIAEWFKKEGDKVAEGDLLVGIETDKATMEYPSPASGVLLKIIVPVGKTVALQAPIAVIGAKGEDFSSLLAGSKAESKAQAPVKEIKEKESDKKAAAAVAEKVEGRVKASPLAKKIAEEKGIELAGIQGSGPLGRVIAADVREGTGAIAAVAPRAVAGAVRADRKIPHSMMRKTIAKRLLQGKNQAPHFYLTVSAKIAELLKWKDRLNAKQGEKGIRVSLNDLVTVCVSRALLKHPMVNASWQEDCIVQFGAVHIATAVALPEGLITPVLRNADQLGVLDTAASIRELVGRAKAGKLQPPDYQGGTFTISNLGMTVVEEFTAIINAPEACILAVGRSQNTVLVDDKGRFYATPVMKMTLSCDHRVVDGMVGAQFLATLVEYLENPVDILS